MKGLAVVVLLGAVAFGDERWIELEGKRVQVTPEGTIGRTYTDSDVPKEIERLLAQPAPSEQNVWQCRVFIFRGTDADWEDSDGKKRHTKAEMTDEDVEGLQKAVIQFQRCVEAYTGRLLRLDLATRVIDEPLTKVSGSKGQYLAWSEATDPFIGEEVEEGKVDSVLVFWIPGDIQLGIYWGGTVGGCYKGAGYSSIAYIHPGACDVHAYFEVALHEWLHQAEWARAWKMGYADLPDLHMGMQAGYPPDRVSRGWMDWYRDFMGVYFTPRTWRKMRMMRDDPDRPRVTGPGGFCHEWLVAGPFANENDSGLDRDFADEDRCRPTKGERSGGEPWSVVECGEVIDLRAAMSPPDNGVAYLHAYVTAPEGPARLWIGSDDGVKAWWNGRRVLQHHLHRPCVADQDWVDVEVREGWNRLLLKVDQGFGGWAACARLATRAGGPIEATWRATRPDKDVVADDDDPALAKDWVPTEYAWSEVEDDPWRLLPQWGETELRGLTRLKRLTIRGGEECLLLDPGEDEIPGDPRGPVRVEGEWRRRGDPADVTLDNQLTFSREAIALVPVHTSFETFDHHGNLMYPPTLYLIRPDVAPLVAARFVDRQPKWLAWIQVDRRPAYVVRARGVWPCIESGLFMDRRGDVGFDLGASRRVLVGGQQADVEIQMTNLRREAVPVALRPLMVEGEGVLEELQVPAEFSFATGQNGVARYRLTAPAEVLKRSRTLIVATATVDGVEMRDVVAVELRDAWEVTLEAKGGGPADRALRGAAHPLLARVRSNLEYSVKGVLSVTAPEGWLPGGSREHAFELPARGEASFDLPLAIPADWEGIAKIEVTATPENKKGMAQLGVKARTARVSLEAQPWCLVGPFSNRDRGGFATAYAPEGEDDWSGGFDGATGRVRAFDVASPGVLSLDHANLLPVFPPGEWFVVYARIHVHSAEERAAQLRLGSDDTITAWWNHKQVIAKDVYRPAAPDQEVLPVTLRKGDNVLVLKVGQGGGGWEYYFRITDPEGAPVAGLTYQSR